MAVGRASIPPSFGVVGFGVGNDAGAGVGVAVGRGEDVAARAGNGVDVGSGGWVATAAGAMVVGVVTMADGGGTLPRPSKPL